MKKIILVMAIFAAFLPQLKAQQVSCKIKGSDTCLPLTQKEAEEFMKKYSGSSIMVTGGGSGVGLSALLSGTTDIAQSSRKMKMDEKMKMQDAGKAFTEKIIAYDALAVIVHPSNPASGEAEALLYQNLLSAGKGCNRNLGWRAAAFVK